MHLFLQLFIILITCITGHKGISSTNKIIESNLAIELYLDGNYVEAISEWQTLAKNGEENAQFILGTVYRLGNEGVTKNINKAIKWYSLAAEQGNEYAQYNLGKIYESEKDIVDYELAAKWYLRGAQNGNAFSQLKLGSLYIKGKGVPKNLQYAHMWLNVSGAQGNHQAINKKNSLQKTMSFSELKVARILAKKCFQNNYKKCQ